MQTGFRAILIFSVASALWASELHLKNRVVDTASTSVSIDLAGVKRLHPGSSHLILQFKKPVSNDVLSELARRGAVVTAAIPDRAVMAAVPDEFTTFGMDVEYAGRLTLSDKISAALDRERTTAALVEFHSDVDAATARALLSRQNLGLTRSTSLLPNHFLVRGTFPQLRALARFDEVAYVFPASKDLSVSHGLAGCVGALTQGGSVPQYALVGHGWAPNALGAVDLTYVFQQLTTKLSANDVQAEVERAFQQWATYAPVTFTEGTQSQGLRTIAIEFVSGAHNDPFSFDGPGGILAHTFYPAPPNPEPLAGDMHFDDDEPWHIGTSTDVYTVALHEAGHALGLGHSDDPESVMYPYYRFDKELNASDIAGIQALYGKRADTPVPVSPTPVAPTTPVVNNPVPAPTTPANPVPTTPLNTPVNPVPAVPILLSIDNGDHGALTTSAPTMMLTGHASHFTGNVQITWQTDHGAAGLASGDTTWSAFNVPLVIGSNTITITAMDEAHQSAVAVLQMNRQDPATVPAAPPTLAITTPAVSIFSTDQPSITLKGMASSSIGIASVGWRLFGSAGVATGTSSWSATIPLYSGTNQITIKAYDTSGNSRSASLTVVRQ